MAIGVAWFAINDPTSVQGDGVAAVQAPAAALETFSATRFVPNRGQWDDEVRYAVLGSEAAWLHDDGFTVRFVRQQGTRSASELLRDGLPDSAGSVLRTRFSGLAESTDAEDRLPGVHHFLRGRDATRWQTSVPAFARVTLRQVMAGIDVMFRGIERDAAVFEYDLLLERGADLGAFVARCEGAQSLRIDVDGRLCITLPTPSGTIELAQERPVAWQQTDRGLRPLEVSFRLVGEDGYGFCAVDLDSRWSAVIDPGVAWSTYLGGGASDSVNDLAWAPGAGIWLAGWAGSMDFPVTTGAFQTTGERDGFVARLDEGGNALQYSTYFGGSEGDEVRGIDLGPGLTPTIVGFTESPDLPVTPLALQPHYGGASPIVPIGDGFVTRLSAAGDALLSSTYLGGAFDDVAESVVVDAAGNANVAGWTSSGNFPTTAGVWQPALGGGLTLQADGFVSRVAADGQGLIWSTYVGSTLNDQLLDIALDPVSGEVVVAGWSISANFPTTPLAYRTSSAGSLDMVVCRLTASGSGPVWSGFLGGIADDVATAVALGDDGSVWLGGWTDSSNYPATLNAPQQSVAGGDDGTVSQLSADGQTLLFSTLLGGGDEDKVRDLAVDGSELLVVGQAGDGFPVTLDAAQPLHAGGVADGFVSHLTDGGATLAYSSFAGGSNVDDMLASVEFAAGLGVLGGWSFAADFPVTTGAMQTQLLGVEDGVVMMLDLLSDLGGGLEVSASEPPSRRFVDAGEHELLAFDAHNKTSRWLTLEAVRVLVAGRGFAPTQVQNLELWIDDPDVPGPRDERVGGPVAILADDTEVEVVLQGVTLAADAAVTLRAFAPLAADASAGTVEVACAVVGSQSWTLRSFGAGGGPNVSVLGSGRVVGPVLVTGALPGDADGDGEFTVLDLRKMCTRLGVTDRQVDVDGDQIITLADVDHTRAGVLSRPSLVFAPSTVARGAWMTITGLFPVAGSVTATLGGRALHVGCLTPRELTLHVDSTQSAGIHDLTVYVDGMLVVAAPVLVQ